MYYYVDEKIVSSDISSNISVMREKMVALGFHPNVETTLLTR